MKLSDLRTGLESLNEAYNEVTDQLRMEDSAANACISDALLIWWEALTPDYGFLSNYEEYVLLDAKSVGDHQDTVEQLVSVLRQRDSKNIEIWSGYLLGTLQTYVSKVARTTRDQASRIQGAARVSEAVQARDDYRRAMLLETRIEQATLSRQLRTAVREATTGAEEARSAAESAKTAAGVASGSKLTARFAALSRTQLRTATFFRCLTVLGVLTGIVGMYLLAFAPGATHPADTTTGDAIIRVSLLGAVLGLATYFGKQAGYHRDLGSWAKTIEEQLLTFDGYMEPIHDENIRDGMRAAFAARVFGSSPESKDDSGVTLGSSFISELLAAVGKSGANATK